MQSRLARTASASSLFLVALFLVNCFRAPGTSAASSTGSLRETARMHAPRADHSSTPLPSGKVLIAGGFGGSGTESHPFSTAELYDPRSGSFEPAGGMTLGRSGHTAKLLKNGTVLIVGGWTGRGASRRTAEIYDPATGKFTPTGSLVVERSGNTATLLLNGKVLVTGGVDRSENSLASAEIYDPETGAFSLTGTMSEPRGQHTATILKNGKVLVAGGGSGDYPSQTVYRSADLYDPATGKFTPTGQMTACRHKHAAILLPSGKVLIAGGSDNRDWHGEYSSAELYDPAAGTFRATGPMSTSRFKLPEAVVLLNSGKVLIAGGGRFAEVYDESKGTFTPTQGTFGASRFFASATLLPNGDALITGGYAHTGAGLPATAAAWIYQP
jgi:TATA-box binding protein (TBP) (component of TFIID and TFIIIB)